ncbi:bile acid:sodium symporter family protein [Caldichromatium japonicum]|uniref:Bile acid:sodium symporter family protein n=1 Tax=Caldichromatium japonicum TaxID=2699430 RepID=A0A6G7VE59_9GAMM|nr:bile acid:sodium symporter family protein [Caldichromatium japonicum]QIK38329.1 bile acid:sodium symporter family protein [Caldichromatium japonicum]
MREAFTPQLLLTRWFPLLALIAAALGFAFAPVISPWRAAVMPLLGMAMFGMGMTLKPSDFLAIVRRPGVVVLGVGLQFGLMPLLGWAVGLALHFPPELLIGMVLVGAAPGGTASNVICYLARGDVALSITLTAASTLLAVVMTPTMTWVYARAWVEVPILEMLRSIALVVLVPVGLGLLVRRLAGRVPWLGDWMPLLSVAAILVIIAMVVALNAGRLVSVGGLLLAGVILHNALGLGFGYWGARAFGQDLIRARTLSIEVGMQNSGLAVALALQSFAPASALPGTLFSVWHNLSGALLATWWAQHRLNAPSSSQTRHRSL